MCLCIARPWRGRVGGAGFVTAAGSSTLNNGSHIFGLLQIVIRRHLGLRQLRQRLERRLVCCFRLSQRYAGSNRANNVQHRPMADGDLHWQGLRVCANVNSFACLHTFVCFRQLCFVCVLAHVAF